MYIHFVQGAESQSQHEQCLMCMLCADFTWAFGLVDNCDDVFLFWFQEFCLFVMSEWLASAGETPWLYYFSLQLQAKYVLHALLYVIWLSVSDCEVYHFLLN